MNFGGKCATEAEWIDDRKASIFLMVLNGYTYNQIGMKFGFRIERSGELFHSFIRQLIDSGVAPFDEFLEEKTKPNEVRENRGFWEAKYVNLKNCCRDPSVVAHEFRVGMYIGQRLGPTHW